MILPIFLTESHIQDLLYACSPDDLKPLSDALSIHISLVSTLTGLLRWAMGSHLGFLLSRGEALRSVCHRPSFSRHRDMPGGHTTTKIFQRHLPGLCSMPLLGGHRGVSPQPPPPYLSDVDREVNLVNSKAPKHLMSHHQLGARCIVRREDGVVCGEKLPGHVRRSSGSRLRATCNRQGSQRISEVLWHLPRVRPGQGKL